MNVEDVEVRLFLEGIYRYYGFDFRSYDLSWMRSRIKRSVCEEQLLTVSALQEKVLRDLGCMDRFLVNMSQQNMSLFGNPEFYLLLRHRVVPLLKTYPSLRIWMAGCSTGEEIYSVAIVLREEGLWDRMQIYVTDMSEAILKNARAGVFPVSSLDQYRRNYQLSDGKADFADYFSESSDGVVLDPELRSKILFAVHNLVTDGSFNEFHMIFCRRGMEQFSAALQRHVLLLLRDSLITFGYLALARGDSIQMMRETPGFEKVNEPSRLYRKVASS